MLDDYDRRRIKNAVRKLDTDESVLSFLLYSDLPITVARRVERHLRGPNFYTIAFVRYTEPEEVLRAREFKQAFVDQLGPKWKVEWSERWERLEITRK
jgi:hypothetical protein